MRDEGTSPTYGRRASRVLDDECARIEIDGEGIVCDCDSLAEKLLDADRPAIIGAHISRFISRFSGEALVQDGALKPDLAFLCRCGVCFRTLTHGRVAFATQIFVNERIGSRHERVRLLLREMEPGHAANAAATVCLN